MFFPLSANDVTKLMEDKTDAAKKIYKSFAESCYVSSTPHPMFLLITSLVVLVSILLYEYNMKEFLSNRIKLKLMFSELNII